MKDIIRCFSARADKYACISLLIVTISFTALACTNTPEDIPPTFDPEPPISESQAIDIAKASLDEVIQDIEFAGYDQIRVRTGMMRLRRLQELTQSDLYTPDSPRMQRQIWAIQIGGKFDTDPLPYTVPFGYGIVGIDAVNGDIHLRARYDKEILVEP